MGRYPYISCFLAMTAFAVGLFLLANWPLLPCLFAPHKISVPSLNENSPTFLIPKLLSEFAYVETSDAAGSGVIFTRTDAAGNKIVFVWTCSHVVQTLDDATDAKARTLERCVTVTIENQEFPASVIAYDASEQTDVALLQVEGTPQGINTTVFNLNTPEMGSPLLHIGAADAQHSPPNLFVGIFSAPARKVDGEIVDQLECPSLPGCSGGGVYDSSGKCQGLMEMYLMACPMISCEVPARSMYIWAQQNHVAWAMDLSVPLPKDVIAIK
jgi:S1-C subfamily serine protease